MNIPTANITAMLNAPSFDVEQVVWSPLDADGARTRDVYLPSTVLEPKIWIVLDLFAYRTENYAGSILRDKEFQRLTTLWTVMARNPHHRFVLGVPEPAIDLLVLFHEWASKVPLDLRPCPRDDGAWPLPNVAISPPLRRRETPMSKPGL